MSSAFAMRSRYRFLRFKLVKCLHISFKRTYSLFSLDIFQMYEGTEPDKPTFLKILEQEQRHQFESF